MAKIPDKGYVTPKGLAWDQKSLQALKDAGHTDAAIADMFDTFEAVVSIARKRQSWWDQQYPTPQEPKEPTELSNSAETAETSVGEEPKKKPGRPPKTQQ